MEIKMDRWGGNDYLVHVFLAHTDAPPLWRYAEWMRLVPSLTPLLKSPRGKTSLRVNQMVPNQHDQYFSYGKFGPLFWNDKSHAKWTHDSPVTGETSRDWKFLSMSAWSPGPGYCKEASPDSLFAISVPQDSKGYFYKYIAVLVLETSVFSGNPYVSEALDTLHKITQAVIAARTKRIWSTGKPLHLTDCGCYYMYGLERHTGEPSLDVLKGRNWETVTEKKDSSD